MVIRFCTFSFGVVSAMDLAKLIEILSEERSLRYWLIFVASLRFLSVILGYLFPDQLFQKVFVGLARGSKPLTSEQAALARTFAVWTAVTGLVTLYTAFSLQSEVVKLLCVFTFLIADVYFVIEMLSGSVSFGSITTPFIIASEYNRITMRISRADNAFTRSSFMQTHPLRGFYGRYRKASVQRCRG